MLVWFVRELWRLSMPDGFTDSEKFAKDLSFMTEDDWDRLHRKGKYATVPEDVSSRSIGVTVSHEEEDQKVSQREPTQHGEGLD